MSEPLYTASGKIEFTPEQHLIFLMCRLKADQSAAERANKRKARALADAAEYEAEEKAALESAANLQEWINEYEKRGVTV